MDRTEIPEGWRHHSGGPCPVSPLSKPGVMFRKRPSKPREPGTAEADFWCGQRGELDWWHWRIRKPTENDIIAYKPEQSDGQD
jgi:hypothetical protein